MPSWTQHAGELAQPHAPGEVLPQGPRLIITRETESTRFPDPPPSRNFPRSSCIATAKLDLPGQSRRLLAFRAPAPALARSSTRYNRSAHGDRASERPTPAVVVAPLAQPDIEHLITVVECT